MIALTWLSPLAFAALPLALALVLWPRNTRGAVRLPRALAALFVVLALGHPIRLVGQDGAHHVLVLDRSASVADVLGAPGLEELEAQARGFVALPSGDDVRSLVAVDDSDLGAALAAAARSIPAGERGSVTLVSDGLAADPRWGRAAVELGRRGIPVHVAPLPVDRADLAVVGLDVVGELRVGHPGQVAVEVAGRGPLAVSLSGPEGELARVDGIAVDGTTRVVLEVEPASPGWLRLVAEAVGDDSSPGNESLARTVAVQDPLRALYVGGATADGARRLAEVVGPGIEVVESAPTVEELARSSLVVLDDTPATAIDAASQEAIADAVRQDGLGLWMSGGGAFGPGGWHGEALAELLPVQSLQKEEKRDPSTTLCVIIDTSGSMGGERVQLAKEVARLAIRRLLPHDKVGIVEFYGAKRWAAPIQPASNRIELERALNRLDAGGGTVILPAIEEAYYGMKNVQTRYKHVLVLTDGGVETGAFEPLLRRMSDDGMNVSSVLIGPDAHSEFLVSLANWGKGRFYSVPNRFNLPEILLKQPTSAKLSSYRAGDHPVRARGGDGWWGSTEPAALPALAGYVETEARAGAQVIVETERGAHPVLASWRYGLGRVTALTTEPTGAGTRPWAGWDGYGAWLARVLARTADDARVPYAFDLRRDDAELVVRARRRVPLAPAPELVARVGEETVAVPFDPRGPDLWEARLPAGPDDELRLEARAPGRGGLVRLVSDPLDARTPERQVHPSRALELSALAAATGGQEFDRELPGIYRPTAGGGDDPRAVQDLRPLLLALALAAFLAHLLLRRLPRWSEPR